MKIHLNLKAQWFDMIEQEIKKEEYRALSSYWQKRLTNGKIKIKKQWVNASDVTIIFSNGYAKKRRQIHVRCTNVHVGKGNPLWGALQDTDYYVISLGNIIR